MVIFANGKHVFSEIYSGQFQTPAEGASQDFLSACLDFSLYECLIKRDLWAMIILEYFVMDKVGFNVNC